MVVTFVTVRGALNRAEICIEALAIATGMKFSEVSTCRDVVILVSFIALELAECDTLDVVLKEVVVVLRVICSNEQHMQVKTVRCLEAGNAKGQLAVRSHID